MDPLERVTLQTEISKLQERARKDLGVSAVLQAAVDALKARDWQKAKEKFEEANTAFRPDRKVVDLIVESGKAVSRAEARRYVMRGAVKVDGVQLRQADAKVKPTQQVTFRGALLQG
jgi:RNA-binding protein YlmH